MTWIEPENSKKAVSRAGDKLLDEETSDDEYSIAINILNNWRSSHAFPLTTVQTFLRSKAIKVDRNALIAQRLKRVPSILEKLRRFDTMRLHRMQDIGGCRAVVADSKKVYKLRDSLINSRTRNELKKENDYIKFPKESGYRGIHLIYKYCGSKQDIYCGHMIEIQIRTRIQHAWATAVEIISIFLKESLKSSQGPKEWLRFFELVGVLFSCLENCVPENLNENEIRDIRHEATSLAKELGVVEKLQAFSVSTNYIGIHNKKSGYFLLLLQTDCQQINISHFNKKDLPDATNQYLTLERRHENSSVNVVLVAAKSVRSLRIAYPNYFADSKVFLDKLNTVLYPSNNLFDGGISLRLSKTSNTMN